MNADSSNYINAKKCFKEVNSHFS